MCIDPTGSSLFDGIVPDLTGLATDMWAEHLVVLSPLNSDIRLKFDFRRGSAADEMTGIESIEIIMINCTSRNIGASTITVWEIDETSGTQFVASSSNYHSCDGLVRVCINITQPLSFQDVFLLFDGRLTLYLSDIVFHTNSTCIVNSDGQVPSVISSKSSKCIKLY